VLFQALPLTPYEKKKKIGKIGRFAGARVQLAFPMLCAPTNQVSSAEGKN